MDLVTGSLWIVALSIVSWWIYRRVFAAENVWKKAGIPHASGLTTILGLWKILLHPIHELVLEGYLKQGKVFGSSLFGRTTLTIGDPELIRQVLVKDFHNFIDRLDNEIGDPKVDSAVTFLRGERWKHVRTLISPTFSTGKIKKMTNTILDCAETLRRNLETAAKTGEAVDVKRLFGAFTMDAIASTAFSTKVDSHNDPDNPFIQAAREVFSNAVQRRFLLAFIFNRIIRMLKLRPQNLFGSKFFGHLAMRLAEERKAKGQARNDFLQLLLEASEANVVSPGDTPNSGEEGSENGVNGNQQHIPADREASSEKYKGLNEDELVAQCITFFLAGYETIASTLTFAAYELALHQHVQDTLIEEIDDVLKQNKNELTYENVHDMKYLDCVISETLRKYPPAAGLQRIAMKDCIIGETRKITIPKGTAVSIPVYALHYDPENYPDPRKFDPDRFTPEAKAARNPYVYLPFGAGPRNCVAMRFALFELKLCLAHTLRHFRFYQCPETQVPPKFAASQTQLIAPAVFLSVEKR